MPANLPAEWYACEKKLREAKYKEDKIRLIQELISLTPRHKGTERILAQLRHRLKKIREEKVTKTTAKPKFSIKKEGAAQVCIVGLTNSGKSSLLKTLTNVDVEIADYPYTTKQPVVGMMFYGDVQIQLVEIPSTFDPDSVSILHTCDLILILIDSSQDQDKQIGELMRILSERKLDSKKTLLVSSKSDIGRPAQGIPVSVKEHTTLEDLKKEIWSRLGLIRVYTKSPGKPKTVPPVTLPVGSTIRDVAKAIHKDFIEGFKFARVFNSTRFSGQKVGLDYRLNDMDVVEIHSR
jgi:ribosome-interacting GTPase 1